MRSGRGQYNTRVVLSQGAFDVHGIRASQATNPRAKQTRPSGPTRGLARVNSRLGDGDSPGSAFHSREEVESFLSQPLLACLPPLAAALSHASPLSLANRRVGATGIAASSRSATLPSTTLLRRPAAAPTTSKTFSCYADTATASRGTARRNTWWPDCPSSGLRRELFDGAKLARDNSIATVYDGDRPHPAIRCRYRIGDRGDISNHRSTDERR